MRLLAGSCCIGRPSNKCHLAIGRPVIHITDIVFNLIHFNYININVLIQHCSNSSALAMELIEYCTKPSNFAMIINSQLRLCCESKHWQLLQSDYYNEEKIINWRQCNGDLPSLLLIHDNSKMYILNCFGMAVNICHCYGDCKYSPSPQTQ